MGTSTKHNPTYGTRDPGPLFRELPPASARTDPETSRVAERKVTKSGQRMTNAQRVADLVKRYPGRTSRELDAIVLMGRQQWNRLDLGESRWSGLDYHEIARRLPDAETLNLVKRGEARTCDVGGNPCTVWWPK